MIELKTFPSHEADVRVIFAILGIERAEAAKDHDRT